MVTAFGMTSPAGDRLQRGVPGSGKTFQGIWRGGDRQEVERSAKSLTKYLNDYEATRNRRGKRRR